MKVTTHTARILLGLIFFVLGLNPFLHFLPARLPSGLAGQFLNLLIQSHYVFFCRRRSACRRCALACESLRSAGTHPAWTGDRKHPAVSLSLISGGRGVSNFRHDSLGISVFSSPSTLLQPVCAADLLNISSNIPTAMTEEALCRLDATPVFAAVVADISV